MAKRILITGASAGIGRAAADRLHRRGDLVVGASRRSPDDVGWQALTMDVDDDASVEAGVAEVSADGALDAVVACAGWGLAGSVEQTPIDMARAQLETNFFGAARVVKATLPALRASKGRIVLISSIGGLLGIPYQSYYSASKFAMEGWAEALAYEVSPFGVEVALIEPGNFKTDFTASRQMAPVVGDDPYEAARRRAVETMERDELGGADPDQVAAAIEQAVHSKRPRRRQTVGPVAERLGPLARRLLPARAFEAAARSSLGV